MFGNKAVQHVLAIRAYTKGRCRNFAWKLHILTERCAIFIGRARCLSARFICGWLKLRKDSRFTVRHLTRFTYMSVSQVFITFWRSIWNLKNQCTTDTSFADKWAKEDPDRRCQNMLKIYQVYSKRAFDGPGWHLDLLLRI